jgi:hypothetical protein
MRFAGSCAWYQVRSGVVCASIDVQPEQLVFDRRARDGLRRFVDLVEDRLALGRRLRLRERAVQLARALEVRRLGGVIDGAELVGALEQQHVLEVVREPGRVRRIVTTAGAHGDPALHARLVAHRRDVHGHAVGQPMHGDAE